MIPDFEKWYGFKRAFIFFKLLGSTWLQRFARKNIDSSWLKIFLQFLNFSRLLRSPSKAKSVHELSATIYDSLPQSLKEPVAVRSKIEDPELQQQRFELTRLVFEAFSILTVFAGNSKEGCNWRHGLSAAIKLGSLEKTVIASLFHSGLHSGSPFFVKKTILHNLLPS